MNVKSWPASSYSQFCCHSVSENRQETQGEARKTNQKSEGQVRDLHLIAVDRHVGLRDLQDDERSFPLRCPHLRSGDHSLPLVRVGDLLQPLRHNLPHTVAHYQSNIRLRDEFQILRIHMEPHWKTQSSADCVEGGSPGRHFSRRNPQLPQPPPPSSHLLSSRLAPYPMSRHNQPSVRNTTVACALARRLLQMHLADCFRAHETRNHAVGAHRKGEEGSIRRHIALQNTSNPSKIGPKVTRNGRLLAG